MMQQPVESKKKLQMPIIVMPTINISRWFLLAFPLSVVGFWLVLHPEIITGNLDKPYMLLAGPALVGSILGGWFLVKFFQSIVSGCKRIIDALFRGQKEDSSAQFFWAVIVVFMIVSVFASGSFFTNLEHDVIPGLGYITALFIDLVAVQSMRARLNAVRMRDKRGERLYLFGVFVCAGASAFANVYTSLADFTQKVTGVLPVWMLNTAPWFGLVFPALILLLSITADYTLDQTSTKLDPDNYQLQEEKRLRIIEIQQNMLQRRVVLENSIDQLQRQLTANKIVRQFFPAYLWDRFIFPEKHQNLQQVIEQVKRDMQSVYEPQITALSEQIAQQQVTLQRTMSEQIDDMLANFQRTQLFAEVFIPDDTLVNGNLSSPDDTLLFTPDDSVANNERTEKFTPDDMRVNSQVFTPANFEMTPQRTKKSRITVNLSEHRRDTDELDTVNTPANKKATRERTNSVTSINAGDAAKRIERILKRNPKITVTELAEKAKVSRGYASEKRIEFLKNEVSA